jgi:hypothetical protein
MHRYCREAAIQTDANLTAGRTDNSSCGLKQPFIYVRVFSSTKAGEILSHINLILLRHPLLCNSQLAEKSNRITN